MLWGIRFVLFIVVYHIWLFHGWVCRCRLVSDCLHLLGCGGGCCPENLSDWFPLTAAANDFYWLHVRSLISHAHLFSYSSCELNIFSWVTFHFEGVLGLWFNNISGYESKYFVRPSHFTLYSIMICRCYNKTCCTCWCRFGASTSNTTMEWSLSKNIEHSLMYILWAEIICLTCITYAHVHGCFYNC